jgi:hypothetical protein
MKTSTHQKRKWFLFVNQRLGEISVMIRKRDHWKISETARRAEMNFPITRWEMI